MPLSFDPTPYQGLYRADGYSNYVEARFADPLDPGSASIASHYRIVRADEAETTIPVNSVWPSGDGRMVKVVIGGSFTPNHVYVLTVSDVLGVAAPGKPQPAYSGSASFPSAGSTAGHTSSVIEHAQHDLGVYTSLYYQLTDPVGISATLGMSLLTLPLYLTGAVWQGLLGWLFTGPGSVYSFLADRAIGGAAVPPPQTPYTVVKTVPVTSRKPDQIIRLSVVFTIQRTSRAVLGDLQTTPFDPVREHGHRSRHTPDRRTGHRRSRCVRRGLRTGTQPPGQLHTQGRRGSGQGRGFPGP